MCLSHVHGEVYSIQHYVIKFVSDLRQVGSFLLVFRFPPPIKLTIYTVTLILLKSGVKHHKPNQTSFLRHRYSFGSPVGCLALVLNNKIILKKNKKNKTSPLSEDVRAIWFETISDVLENSVAFAKNKKFSRQKFYGCHHEMVDHRYEISMVQMAMAIFPITSNYSFISRQQDLYRNWLYE